MCTYISAITDMYFGYILSCYLKAQIDYSCNLFDYIQAGRGLEQFEIL